MIEFPTDAKFSNLQIKPSAANRLLSIYMKNLPDDVTSLLKKNINNDWVIPHELIPRDYARLNVEKNLKFSSYSYIHSNLLDLILSADGAETTIYNLKVGGVYRLLSSGSADEGGISLESHISDAVNDENMFFNTLKGYEISKSITESTKQYVYTIAPKVQKYREISIGNATFKISNI
tara:strand:- start:3337 stop:3870 length:534 start_codon:yes stop_codon:yes gene_type:complete